MIIIVIMPSNNAFTLLTMECLSSQHTSSQHVCTFFLQKVPILFVHRVKPFFLIVDVELTTNLHTVNIIIIQKYIIVCVKIIRECKSYHHYYLKSRHNWALQLYLISIFQLCKGYLLQLPIYYFFKSNYFLSQNTKGRQKKEEALSYCSMWIDIKVHVFPLFAVSSHHQHDAFEHIVYYYLTKSNTSLSYSPFCP